MYQDYFGFKEPPFTLTPNPEFLFMSRCHQEAYAHLLYAIESRAGFIELSGEVGTGKILMCRQLLASLPTNVVSAYLLNPRLSPPELLRSVGLELGLQLPRGLDEHALCEALEAELMQLAAHDQRVVLCIDEAQALPLDSLEALRLLSNLETAKRKLIHIVLFGQPELDEMLQTRAVRSLASRIVFSARLDGLSRAELGHYLQHRLVVAGWRGPVIFSPAALWCLHRASGGVPRLANVLAHKCLMLAYGHGLHRVGLRMAWAAAQDRSVP